MLTIASPVPSFAGQAMPGRYKGGPRVGLPRASFDQHTQCGYRRSKLSTRFEVIHAVSRNGARSGPGERRAKVAVTVRIELAEIQAFLEGVLDLLAGLLEVGLHLFCSPSAFGLSSLVASPGDSLPLQLSFSAVF